MQYGAFISDYELCMEIWHTLVNADELVIHRKEVYKFKGTKVPHSELPDYVAKIFDDYADRCWWIYSDSLDF